MRQCRVAQPVAQMVGGLGSQVQLTVCVDVAKGWQMYASGDRTAALASVTMPALVVHGEADPLIQLPGAPCVS